MTRINVRATGLFTQLLLTLITVYQWIFSPFVGQHCRYQPTCSRYATEAIKQFGPVRGTWLAIKRISRCHPWHEGGYDPVPDRDS